MLLVSKVVVYISKKFMIIKSWCIWFALTVIIYDIMHCSRLCNKHETKINEKNRCFVTLIRQYCGSKQGGTVDLWNNLHYFVAKTIARKECIYNCNNGCKCKRSILFLTGRILHYISIITWTFCIWIYDHLDCKCLTVADSASSHRKYR